MKKMTTLYKKDPNDLGRVINEVDPDNAWVFTDEGVKATRKFDGTAAAIINGVLYKRYDAKKGKQAPEGAIPCQEPDEITGHHPHWVKCDDTKKEDRYFWEAFESLMPDGTYELCGPKVQGNPEKLQTHQLVRHGEEDITQYIDDIMCGNINFATFKYFLSNVDIEGIVFHHPDSRMCKLRKSDFGIKR